MTDRTRRGPGIGAPDLDQANSSPLIDTEDSGALMRWSQTREALLPEDAEIEEDDEVAGLSLAFPSCIIADQLTKVGR